MGSTPSNKDGGCSLLHDLWRRSVGMEPRPSTVLMPDLASLRQTEWSDTFEQYMRNRLVFGAVRYGLVGDKGKPRYDRIKSIRQRLDAYEETGNDEHLVDVANMAQLEFIEGIHPNKHFASIDDGVHTPVCSGTLQARVTSL